MVNSGTYYGLSVSASNLDGNPYYNYIIFMYFSWMVNSGTYYSLSLSASNMGGNFYNYIHSLCTLAGW